MPGDPEPLWLKLVVPALTALCGALSGLLVAQYQSFRTARKERLAKEAAVQFAYLDPLRIATENLAWKLFEIERKIQAAEQGPGGRDWMRRMFHDTKHPREIVDHKNPSQTEWAYWCNGEGFFAVSTIYATVTYFLHARRTRRRCTKDRELIRRLDAVRLAVGHEFGIYIMLQDSIGEYVGDEKGLQIGYRRFCTLLFNDEERAWFLNVLDYYREIDKKTAVQRRAVMVALRDLLTFLGQITRMSVHDPLADHPGFLRSEEAPQRA